MTKIKDKEYKAIEAFIEHTKKILVTKQQIPMKLKHKTGGLVMEITIDRLDGK